MTDPIERAALEWQAEEHATQARIDAKVEAMQSPPGAPAAEAPKTDAQKQAEQAAQASAAVQSAMPQVFGIVWKVLDRGAQSFLGPHCAASKEELDELARLTVPVAEKWLPNDLSKLFATPEGALAFAVVCVYGFKAMAGAPKPPELPTAPPEAPAPAPETAPVTA